MKKLRSFLLLLLALLPLAAAGARPARSSGALRNYLPLVVGPSLDLTVDGMEVTQAIQNAGNTIPLVQGRRTLVRVYARVDGQAALENTTLRLAAARDGAPLGVLAVAPQTVVAAPARGNTATTFNAELPPAWLAGNVQLTATVDPGNAVQESDETNNEATLALTFNPLPPLDVTLVPINYTHAPDGHFFPYYPADGDDIRDYVMKVFPVHQVSLSSRAGVGFEGDLSLTSEWNRLLNLLVDLKQADGAPAATVYYGLVPTKNGNGDFYPRAWGGWGALWTRASLGIIEGGGRLAAHEFGHNFGRRHAPCGNVAGPDPNYPYDDGSIGEYGLDVSTGQLWAPQVARDLMSYCSPRWISDYTYLALFQDQAHFAQLQPAQEGPGLLLRARFDEAGAAGILPVYPLSTRLSRPPAAATPTSASA